MYRRPEAGHTYLPSISAQFGMLLILLFAGCGAPSGNEGFVFSESREGIELSENGVPVYFYRSAPKSGDGEHWFNNYLHPLYSLQGDTLTEEFPEDHFHHRGVFWAWHQIYVDGQNVGDGWMMDKIIQEIASTENRIHDTVAELHINALWSSKAFRRSEPFMNENTLISVHPLQDGYRTIDFEVSLEALVPGVQIGGSDNEKGYGGFSVRIRMPDDLVFTSASGRVSPENLQVTAGPWMDFSASYGAEGEVCGITLLCHPDTPNYPAPWILRQKSSMQNIVFPGRERIDIPVGKQVVLKYRLILHNGSADTIDPRQLEIN